MHRLVFLAVAAMTAAVYGQEIAGDWQGSLDAGGKTLHLALHVTKDGSGALRATMDSIDQGAMGMPVDTITLAGNAVKFEQKSIGGAYEGTLTADKIAGMWMQGGATLPLDWRRGAGEEKPAEPLDEKTAREDSRIYTQWFYSGRTAEMWAKMSPEMQHALGDEAKLKGFRDRVASQLGAETKVLEETLTASGALRIYRRLATFEKTPGNFELQFALDAKGTIDGFYVKRAAK